MGTRNLTKVIDKTGKVVVAQYGQWGGYPEGQGKNILEFIQGHRVLDTLEQALEKCKFVEGTEGYVFFTSSGDYDKDTAVYQAYYPNFSRNTGSDILKVIMYSTGEVPLVDESDFENDTLMCEGVYTLDFQTREFYSKWDGKTRVIQFDEVNDFGPVRYAGLFVGETDEEVAERFANHILGG